MSYALLYPWCLEQCQEHSCCSEYILYIWLCVCIYMYIKYIHKIHIYITEYIYNKAELICRETERLKEGTGKWDGGG